MALALAGMDVGTAFGGLGAAREMSFSVFAEPALLLCVLTFAILAGTTNLDLIAATFRDGGLGLRVSLALQPNPNLQTKNKQRMRKKLCVMCV